MCNATFNSFAASVTKKSYIEKKTKKLSRIELAQNIHIEQKRNIELTTNFTLSKLDYNIITAADSILKWRDSVGAGIDFSISKNLNNAGNKMIINYRNIRFSNGTMSDYDMENGYPSYGIFSESTKVDGTMNVASIVNEILTFSNSQSDTSFSFGYEYRTLQLNPSSVYQVIYCPNCSSTNSGVYYSPNQTQNTKVTMHGIQLGASHKRKTSANHNLIFSGEVFMPISFVSEQYNWGYQNNDGGYDWKLSTGDFGSGYGLRGKIQNQVRISQNAWWNIYTFAEITSINSPLDTNRRNKVVTNNGNAKDVKIYQFGIGTGLTFN